MAMTEPRSQLEKIRDLEVGKRQIDRELAGQTEHRPPAGSSSFPRSAPRAVSPLPLATLPDTAAAIVLDARFRAQRWIRNSVK